MGLRSIVLVLGLCLLGVGDASAKGWPQPTLEQNDSGEIEVLFTFDDGPNPTTTPQVLDILKQHHIHAVFFLVGQMLENKKAPKIVERMLAEGHILANHTMTHQDLCRVKEDRAIHDLDRGKETIEKVAGIDPVWFRAPYGVRCDRLEAMMEARHLKHFHWDLDPQEWRHGNVDKTVKYVTGELSRAGGRVVLLMHDVKPVTVKALPQILDWIDAENKKRERSRKSKIRVLQANTLAAEQLPKGLVAWWKDATAGARALPSEIASVLP